MTIQQAIEKADMMKQGNVAEDTLKVEWLTELDKLVYNEVLLKHDIPTPNDGETSKYWTYSDDEWHFITSPTYTEDNTEVELLAEAPYDMMYVYWLMAKIDFYSQEMSKYNTDYGFFDNEYQLYKNKFHQDYRAKATPQIWVGVY